MYVGVREELRDVLTSVVGVKRRTKPIPGDRHVVIRPRLLCLIHFQFVKDTKIYITT